MDSPKRFTIYRQNFIGLGFFFKRDFYDLKLSFMFPGFAVYFGIGKEREW